MGQQDTHYHDNSQREHHGLIDYKIRKNRVIITRSVSAELGGDTGVGCLQQWIPGGLIS